MGCGFSEPIPNYGETFGYVGMVMTKFDKFLLLHAPDDVITAVGNVVR